MVHLLSLWIIFASSLLMADDNLCPPDISTLRDEDIITNEDRLFCSPPGVLKNQDQIPEDLPDNGSVWRVGNRRWSDEWEKKYQDWVRENVREDFFQQINLATDCADAALAIRAIFSRIHQLPASFNGVSFSNFQKEYQKLKTERIWNKENWQESFKKDHRFRTALKDWMNGTGTVNISRDTYQIELIDKKEKTLSKCLAPGSVFLMDGHTEILTINPDSFFPFRISSSTMPVEVRPLSERIFDEFHLSPQKNSNPNLGWLGWNWVVNCSGIITKIPDQKMPYYSNEQNQKDFEKKIEELSIRGPNHYYQKALNLSPEEVKKRLILEVEEMINKLDHEIKQREIMVKNGRIACEKLSITNATDCFISKSPPTYHLDSQGNLFYRVSDDVFQRFSECTFHDPDEPGTHPEETCFNLVDTMNYESFLRPLNPTLGNFYHTHSTPNRDRRLKERMIKLEFFVHQTSYDYDKFKLTLLDKFVQAGSKKISYYHLLQMDSLSPQPWDPEDMRWGSFNMKYLKWKFETNNEANFKLYEEAKKNPEDLEMFKNQNQVFYKELEVFDEYFKNDSH
jgi:hypothetical protein